MTPAAVLSILVKTQGVQESSRALSGLDDSAKRAHSGLDRVQRIARVGLAAGFGVGVVAIKGMVKAAQESETSSAQMQTQLKALGISYGAHAGQIDKVIQKTSQLAGLDDEDLQDAFTNIVRVTGNVNQSLKLTGLAADFARAKHLDVAKAGEIVGKVAGGNTGVLARYGIQLDKNASSSEALAELQKRFAGQAAAYGNTAAGAQDRFKVALENVQETLGQRLLPVLAQVANALADALVWFEKHEVAAKVLVGTVGALVAVLAAVSVAQTVAAAATAVWTAAQWAFNAAMSANPVMLFVLALAALVAGLILAYKHSETFRGIIDAIWGALTTAAGAIVEFVASLADVPAKVIAAGGAFEFVKNAAVAAFEFIKNNWPLILGILTGPIGLFVLAVTKYRDETVAVFQSLPGMIVDAIKALPGLLVAVGAWIVERMIDGFVAMANLIAGAAQWLFDTLKAAVLGYLNMYKTIGSWVLDRVVDGFKVVTSLLGTVGGWLKERVSDFIKAELDVYKTLGSWVLDRIVDGFKTITGLLGTVGGWLKNRVTDFIKLELDGLTLIGTWVLNRIVEGFKVVTDLLGTVGGWLKNRVVELIQLETEGLNQVGSWVLNRVVDGFKTVTESLSGVGSWLKNRIKDALDAAKDGITGLGGTVIDWIVDGLRAGANKIVGFLNGIIHVINKLPGVDIPDIPLFKTEGKGKTEGRARGGAYARTGGLVSSPIMLMGEEAPRHPEYVIPTNPAYRDRARGLLAQAAGAIGFQEGGRWSVGALEDLWRRAGGADRMAHTMAIVSTAESGAAGRYGYQFARNPSGATGLWQILGQEVPGNLFDAVVNAKNAVWKLAHQGLGAWEASKSMWGPLVNGGGGIGGLWDKVKGAVGGALDFLLDGGKGLIGMLPDPGDLGVFSGLGREVIRRVTGWIKGKVAGLLGGGGGGGGVQGNVQRAIEFAMGMGFAHPSAGQLTGGRHTAGSLHYAGRAVDFGDAGHTTAQMQSLFYGLISKFGDSINELFYDRMPFYIDAHRRVAGQFGGHGDHIHIGFRKGGVWDSYAGGTSWVPQTGPYLLHRGEAVIPRDQNTAGGGVVLNAVIDLGRGITERVRLEFDDQGRQLRGAYAAGTGR